MGLGVINPRKKFNFRRSNYFVQSEAKRKKERKQKGKSITVTRTFLDFGLVAIIQ